MDSSNVMRHEENYCIWSGSSIGGCPLEEASEQEKCKVAREVVGGAQRDHSDNSGGH